MAALDFPKKNFTLFLVHTKPSLKHLLQLRRTKSGRRRRRRSGPAAAAWLALPRPSPPPFLLNTRSPPPGDSPGIAEPRPLHSRNLAPKSLPVRNRRVWVATCDLSSERSGGALPMIQLRMMALKKEERAGGRGREVSRGFGGTRDRSHFGVGLE